MREAKLHEARTETTIYKAALDYARRGWPVFPCRPRRKEPLTPRGFYDATTDETQITIWFMQWPDANIAVRTGTVSGFFVLDEDPQHGSPALLIPLANCQGA